MIRPFLSCITAAIILSTTTLAHAADDPIKEALSKSPRHHEWVEVQAGNRKVKTFVVYPEVDKPATVMIVIHENKGLTDWARKAADDVAAAGYIAVAPDLLTGSGPEGGATDSFKSQDDATRAIGKLPPAQVTADLDGVYKYATSIKAGNGKIVVGGFCWGGGQTFRYATHNDKIAAACVFYGPAPRDDDALKNIKAPVYGFYGSKDNRISGQVPDVSKKMKELGKKYEPIIYDGAGHGFMRSGEDPNPNADNKKARSEAWVRLKKILAGV